MTPPIARTVATFLLAVVGGFQVLLALGAPLGAASYGGYHAGTLPAGFRLSSAVAAALYGGLIWLLWSRGVSPVLRRRLLGASAALLVLGVLANLASASPAERFLWAPCAALLAYSLWRARPGTAPAEPAAVL